MARNERTQREYVLPNLDMVQESITRPDIMANNFEINPRVHNNYQFRRTMMEDSSQHLKQFLQLCNTFIYNGVINCVVLLQLFPFSLIDNVFSWLDLIDHDMERTHRKIHAKVLPHQQNGPAKKGNLDVHIKCPCHGLTEWLRLQTFYNGLDVHSRSRLNETT
ncbi:acidic leucine-rich nuclear phosphoprotein 32 family member B-like [Gossypium australe]|uniref:Acidic leucine-rich nuclear phosphoprotein 32 family member B-like n=1 Tax=Gossypium australe TaxID=47621 RepID=A0A5B6VNY7_9ROSI|nr:acidic leucine-rich nuclear phosphoprotein 32 family member B-like [Gossypium australe]